MTLIKEIQNLFENCLTNTCHEIVKDKYFEIIDDGIDKCYINKDKNKKGHFRIINNDSKEINFLAIDKCLFKDSSPPKRCDFSVFDNTIFSFIEIKEANKSAGRRFLRNEAVDQLKSTIIEFSELKLFEKYGFQLEAIICLCVRKSYPTFTSTKQSIVKKFQDEYNVYLKEGNFKQF